MSELHTGIWIAGKPPIKRIVLLWNMVDLFGPAVFQTEEVRDEYLARIGSYGIDPQIRGDQTHFLIIPIAPSNS
jgi:hypothetical protein